MEDALCCTICLDSFDEETHRPLLFASCGHTMCQQCVRGVLDANQVQGLLQCPTCRRQHHVRSIADFPVNHALIHVLACRSLPGTSSATPSTESVVEGSSNYCLEHRKSLELWCFTCKVAACITCLLKDHPHPAHKLTELKDYLKKMQEVNKQKVAEVIDLVETTWIDNTSNMKSALLYIINLIKQRRELQDTVDRAKELERSVKDSNDFGTLTSLAETVETMKEELGILLSLSLDEGIRSYKNQNSVSGDEDIVFLLTKLNDEINSTAWESELNNTPEDGMQAEAMNEASGQEEKSSTLESPVTAGAAELTVQNEDLVLPCMPSRDAGATDQSPQSRGDAGASSAIPPAAISVCPDIEIEMMIRQSIIENEYNRHHRNK